jgi:AcrR family transcriptional regulator
MSPSDTYDKILQTARRLFVQQGYTATSMRQVAAETGIGKATIYHHFPDKQAMVMALLQKSMARMNEARAIVRVETDPRQRIRAAATVSVSYLFESVDIIQIVRREIPDGRDQISAEFMNFFRDYMALLADAIQRGTEQGIFRPVDPADAARVLMTMIQGTFSMAYLGRERPQSIENLSTAILDVYFQGIDAR